ncbi:MAG: hypothetical protein WDN69_31580 [Aliidongia sp.]
MLDGKGKVIAAISAVGTVLQIRAGALPRTGRAAACRLAEITRNIYLSHK